MLYPPTQRREGIDSLLAKNLVVARVLSEMTQQELADTSLISRATIAQLESGYSDPRLSTIVDLANALGISPLFLLIGDENVRALAELYAMVADAKSILPPIPPADLVKMKAYLRTGMLKDRLRAATIGRDVIRSSASVDGHPGASIVAGIFSAISPGNPTALGAVLARLTATQQPLDQPLDEA